jgi:hypothetical protein
MPAFNLQRISLFRIEKAHEAFQLSTQPWNVGDLKKLFLLLMLFEFCHYRERLRVGPIIQHKLFKEFKISIIIGGQSKSGNPPIIYNLVNSTGTNNPRWLN